MSEVAHHKENEHEPKIEIEFFLAAHGSREDYARLSELLKDADVYVPERAAWREKSLQAHQDISAGIREPNTWGGGTEASRVELESIYNKKIPILFIDIPENHPLVKVAGRVMKTDKLEIVVAFRDGKFDEGLKLTKQNTQDLLDFTEERESYIRQKLKEKISTLTEDFPQLKGKQSIRIVVALGPMHTNVANELKNEPAIHSVKKQLGKSTVVFLTQEEIVRSQMSGRGSAQYHDVDYARMWIEWELTNLFPNNISDSLKELRGARKLARHLSLDQIHQLSQDVSTLVSGPSFSTSLKNRLRKLGVTIPKNEDELDALLRTS